MITVNPSKDELKHICKSVSGRDIKKYFTTNFYRVEALQGSLKDYTRIVMDQYAKNFNRGSPERS